jgi:murein DD-endopeptidase MepM/ murein hydrolase activator NlpD
MAGSRRPFVFFTVAVVVMASVAGAVGAQTNSDRIDEFRKKSTENTAEIAAAEDEIKKLQAEQNDLQRTADRVASDLNVANQRLASAEADTQRFDAEAAALQTVIEKTQRELDEAKAATRRSAVLLYQGRSDSSSLLDLIDAASGSGSIVEGKQYLEHVSDKRHADADRVGALRAALDKQQQALDEKRKAADDARDQAAQEQQRVQALYTQQQDAIAAVVAGQNSYQAKLSDLTAQKAQLATDFKAASDEIASELAALKTPPYGDGSLIRPIPGAQIVSGFGPRTDPITGAPGFHPGVDFAAPCGTRIQAAGIGQVLSAGEDGGYGNAIVINHGGGLATLYGHQSAFAVSTGDVVSQGQVIGYVGSTGYSTGCHLHFEVRINGTPVDPVPYLQKSSG